MKSKKFILTICLIVAIAAAIAAALLLQKPADTEKPAKTEIQTAAEETSAVSETETSAADDLAERLSELDGVVSVESVEQNETDAEGNPQFCYKHKYIVTFRQPLDWNDETAGTFDQRVLVGVDDPNGINVAETQGYIIKEANFNNDPRLDMEILLNGNYFEVEHRFFGESKPEGLSNDDTALWEYMTTYNAASDQNKVITEMKKIFSGKWVATGRSKGGLTANMLTMYYPDAVDLTVSYVAPLADPDDDRFYRFAYEEAESVHYGEAERKLVTEFQIECLKKRADLMPVFQTVIDESGAVFREQTTPDVLFDVCVLETAIGTWQYYQEFDKIENCLNMPEENEEEKAAKMQAMAEIITGSVLDTDITSPYFPYFVQASKELGNYYYDFSFLRNALREKGLDPADYLTVREDHMYNAADLAFTDAQKEAFVYDDTMNRNLKKWAETTDSHVIMIYGSSDPWYAVRVPDTDNPNIKIFVSQRTPHVTVITDERQAKNSDYSFEPEEQKKIFEAIYEWLK